MPDSGLKWIHNAWLYYDSKKNFTPSTENNKSKTQQTDHISQFCYHTYRQSYFICRCNCFSYIEIQQHPFNGHFPGLPGWASTRKVKTIWILLKQEIVSGSGISWAICKSAPCSRQITNPLSFKQARCPSCHPTNSIKALKAIFIEICYKFSNSSEHRECHKWFNKQVGVRHASTSKAVGRAVYVGSSSSGEAPMKNLCSSETPGLLAGLQQSTFDTRLPTHPASH